MTAAAAAAEARLQTTPKTSVLWHRDPRVNGILSDSAQQIRDASPDNFHAALTSASYLSIGSDKSRSNMVSLGLYADHLDGITKHLPPQQVLVMWYEAVEHNPFEMLRNIESFLGLPHFDFGKVRLSTCRKMNPDLIFHCLTIAYSFHDDPSASKTQSAKFA